MELKNIENVEQQYTSILNSLNENLINLQLQYMR